MRDVLRRILFSPLAVLRSKAYDWSTISATQYDIALEPLTGVYDEVDFKLRRLEKFLCLVSELTARRPGKAVLSVAGDGIRVLPWSRTYISEPGVISPSKLQPSHLPFAHVLRTIVLGYIPQVSSTIPLSRLGADLSREMSRLNRGHALWFVVRFSPVYST